MLNDPQDLSLPSPGTPAPSQTPIQRVGVIGGGQLAWMMAGAAKKLGLSLVVQTETPQDSAVAIASDVILASVADAQATVDLANRCDVITFENEFVDLIALGALAEQGVCFRPHLTSLAPLLDKYEQRCFLRDRQLPTPQFAILTELDLDSLTFPAVLKTRRNGYDGYGTFIVKHRSALQELLQKISQTRSLDELIWESFVPFERELAVMVARSQTGEIVVYPIVESQQENQVCRRVTVPTPLPTGVAQQVDAIARAIVESLQFIGILGVELFLTHEGEVLVNEIAPRTHNSGHYSLDACVTSQFEQQLRAVTGLPLGSAALNCQAAVMVNLLGFESSTCDYAEKRQQLAALPHAQLYWYNKPQSRPGRKLGHVTVCLPLESAATPITPWAEQTIQQIEAIWYP
ncbi:MAG: 5-(carboxyamino)imidazole ribonucleotide synthase [Synechococcales bacterium]|nr:5-(carboxyamino)imidazole ribonucleotide synthase [Synechococcales bacterium]